MTEQSEDMKQEEVAELESRGFEGSVQFNEEEEK